MRTDDVVVKEDFDFIPVVRLQNTCGPNNGQHDLVAGASARARALDRRAGPAAISRRGIQRRSNAGQTADRSQPFTRQFLPTRIQRHTVRGHIVLVERHVNSLVAVRGFLAADQHAGLAAARALELRVETDVLERLIEEQPSSAASRLHCSGYLACLCAPDGIAKRVPPVQARTFKGRIGNEGQTGEYRYGEQHGSSRGR